MRTLHAILSRLGFVIKKRRPAIPRPDATATIEIKPENLMQAIHGRDIYENFDYQRNPFDPAGWGIESPALKNLIVRIKPSFIIEIGTWKGASALHMAGIRFPWPP